MAFPQSVHSSTDSRCTERDHTYTERDHYTRNTHRQKQLNGKQNADDKWSWDILTKLHTMFCSFVEKRFGSTFIFGSSWETYGHKMSE